MYKLRNVFVVMMLFVMTTLLQAQSGTNSPYTRFGYGDISVTSFSASRGMGGLGIGYRAPNTINPINPASFTVIDTLTFMFDLGGSAKYTQYKTGNQTGSSSNGSFDYINMLFPITKWMGMSFGMNPYSLVGYSFSNIDTLRANTLPHDNIPGNPTSDDIVSQQTYEGTGGLSQINGGIAAKIKNHLSLGINASYLFGNIYHDKTSILTSTSGYTCLQSNNLYINDFRLRYGAQYFTSINKKHDINVGLIYENKTSLNGDYEFINTGGGTSDTINSKYGFEFPNMYGFGLYYTYNKKLSVGFDYSSQQWANAKYYGKTDSLSNANKLSVGLEYLPNMFSKKFYDRIRYRLGATYSNSYIKMDDKFNNYAFTLGFGIPMRRNASFLNIAFEYGKTGENTGNMIQENYYKVSLSSTFIEKWFMKNVIR